MVNDKYSLARKKILVIIPAYNEEKSISGVIRKIRRFSEVDILVVNDGSKDATSRRAKEAGVKVIDLPFNLGIGGAVQTGYLFAFKNDYDVAVQIDADGQHNPDDLLKIIEPVLQGQADMVIGSRFIEFTGYHASMGRQIGIRIFSAVVSRINGQLLRDTTSGYRAVNKQVISYFARNYPTDYPEVEALVLLKREGFNVKEIPVKMAHREHGQSSITPLRSIYYMVKVLLAVFMNLLRENKKEA